MDRHWTELREARRTEQARREVWNFNIERLQLTILWVDEKGLPQHCHLDPLNVWEFNEDGSVFDRAMLALRVEDWLHRIENVYATVESWAKQAGLASSRARTILMSEELMQRFAIPDRELSILDLDRNGAPVMSVVPVGLWVIGSNGRIDLITSDRTAILIDVAEPLASPNWVYHQRGKDRSFCPWGQEAFQELTHMDAVA